MANGIQGASLIKSREKHFSKLYKKENRITMNSIRNSIQFFIVFLFLSFASTAFMGTVSASVPEHQNLPDDITSVNCFSCHVNEKRNDLPSNHLPTKDSCGSCHNVVAWTPAQFVHNENSTASNAIIILLRKGNRFLIRLCLNHVNHVT